MYHSRALRGCFSREFETHQRVFHSLKVREQSSLGGLAIIGVDVQRSVHANSETLLRRVHRLPGTVATRIAENLDSVSEAIHCVRNEHDVLIP